MNTFIIDCFPDSASFYRNGYAIVAIDVIRATTMAITAVNIGRRCFPVTSVDEAQQLARQLDNPILAGELGGDMPAGFEMSNSPADLLSRSDTHRPIVLLSSSGTQLIAQARGADAVYLSCFRNFSATARHISARHKKVALIGAGSRGEFREEDQMGCAWVAQALMGYGFFPENASTLKIAARWKDARAGACTKGNSAKYLQRSGQVRDLNFIVDRVDDLAAAFMMHGCEVVQAKSGPAVGNLGLAAPVPAEAYDAS